jgi:serine/threonine protein kinase
MGVNQSRVDATVPAPRPADFSKDSFRNNVVTDPGSVSGSVKLGAEAPPQTDDQAGDDDVDDVSRDVVAWQRKHCNDGYYDHSEAQDILAFLDPQVLVELAKSVDLALEARERQLVRWKRGELLGTGAFGRVYLGLNEADGTLMAAKQIPLTNYQSGGMDEILDSMEREITLMSRLRHENIVQYIGSQRDEYVKANSHQHEEFLTIFMEYVPGGSITSLLRKFGRFNETLVRLYTKQILTGLAYLHAHAVVHRDIKGGNVLVDRSGVCKLSDFGASKSLDTLETATATEHGPKSLRGTPAFMAPEVVKQTGYGRKSDVWSVGCTVIEMITGKPPWSNYDNPVAAMFAIAVSNEMPQLPPDLSPEAVDFLQLCFKRDPVQRPTAAELLRHPFIAPGQKPKGPALDTAVQTAMSADLNVDPATTTSEDAGVLQKHKHSNTEPRAPSAAQVAPSPASSISTATVGTALEVDDAAAAKPLNPFGRRRNDSDPRRHTRNSSAPDSLNGAAPPKETTVASAPVSLANVYVLSPVEEVANSKSISEGFAPLTRKISAPAAVSNVSHTAAAIIRVESNPANAVDSAHVSPLEALAMTVHRNQTKRRIPVSGLTTSSSFIASRDKVKTSDSATEAPVGMSGELLPGGRHAQVSAVDDEIPDARLQSMLSTPSTPGGHSRGIHARRKNESTPVATGTNARTSLVAVPEAAPLTVGVTPAGPGLWATRKIRVAPQDHSGVNSQADEDTATPAFRGASWGQHIYEAEGNTQQPRHVRTTKGPSNCFLAFLCCSGASHTAPREMEQLVLETRAPTSSAKSAPIEQPARGAIIVGPRGLHLEDVDINVDTAAQLAKVRDALAEDIQETYLRVSAADQEMAKCYSDMLISFNGQSLGIHGKGGGRSLQSRDGPNGMRDSRRTPSSSPAPSRADTSYSAATGLVDAHDTRPSIESASAFEDAVHRRHASDASIAGSNGSSPAPDATPLPVPRKHSNTPSIVVVKPASSAYESAASSPTSKELRMYRNGAPEPATDARPIGSPATGSKPTSPSSIAAKLQLVKARAAKANSGETWRAGRPQAAPEVYRS